MSALVAVSQRVAVDPRHGERRDALDQRWTAFLGACGYVPLPLPNDQASALALLETVPVRGLLLTGGNTLAAYGGDAPERDGMEAAAFAHCRALGLPVLGVCRGMQHILHLFGVPLEPVTGHVAVTHALDGQWHGRSVNSFHDFAAFEAGPFQVLARAPDSAIEAIGHPDEPIHGLMWHPERTEPFEDVGLFRTLFQGTTP